jgi:hypothetical protein
LEEDIFSKTDSNILYKPLNIKADEKGNIEAVYSIYIYNSLQHVKHCISRYLLLPLDEFQYQSSLSRFTLRVNKTVLNDAYNQLIKFGFIPKGTDKKNFVNVFTGGLVKKPIVWLGGYNSLAYLVKGLLKYEAIKSLKNKHWKEVQKHFVTEDGKITDTDSLRNSDPPEDASNLDLIIETFCTPIE